ncbi:MAG: hypothetical protein ABIH35_02210 [Patescibacteria group bacterium]
MGKKRNPIDDPNASAAEKWVALTLRKVTATKVEQTFKQEDPKTTKDKDNPIQT